MRRRSRENTKEEIKRMHKERRKRKRRQRVLERRNRVDERLLAELKEERGRMDQQRKIYSYLSRKYYDRWHSLLKKKEELNRKSIPVRVPNQRKVLIEKPIEVHVPEIDLNLLETPSTCNQEKSNYLGTGMFGFCQQMFYRGMPVAVKNFYSASSEDVKREARIMMTLQHQNIPFALGVSTTSVPKLLVMSYYDINSKPYTMYTALHDKSLQLSHLVWCSILLQLAEAIFYLNSKGFIHRDIKLDNVLVSFWNDKHRAVLIDFGKCSKIGACSAKQLSPEEQQEYQKKHCHIAPEIVSGASPPSVPSDIYSFGQIVYSIGKHLHSTVLKSAGIKCTNSNPKSRPHLNEVIMQLSALAG